MQPGNPQWIQWLEEWEEQTTLKPNSSKYQVEAISKAIGALKKCPVTFKDPQDAQQIKFVGPATIKYLSNKERLASISVESDSQSQSQSKSKRPKRQRTTSSNNATKNDNLRTSIILAIYKAHLRLRPVGLSYPELNEQAIEIFNNMPSSSSPSKSSSTSISRPFLNKLATDDENIISKSNSKPILYSLTSHGEEVAKKLHMQVLNSTGEEQEDEDGYEEESEGKECHEQLARQHQENSFRNFTTDLDQDDEDIGIDFKQISTSTSQQQQSQYMPSQTQTISKSPPRPRPRPRPKARPAAVPVAEKPITISLSEDENELSCDSYPISRSQPITSPTKPSGDDNVAQQKSVPLSQPTTSTSTARKPFSLSLSDDEDSDGDLLIIGSNFTTPSQKSSKYKKTSDCSSIPTSFFPSIPTTQNSLISDISNIFDLEGDLDTEPHEINNTNPASEPTYTIPSTLTCDAIQSFNASDTVQQMSVPDTTIVLDTDTDSEPDIKHSNNVQETTKNATIPSSLSSTVTATATTTGSYTQLNSPPYRTTHNRTITLSPIRDNSDYSFDSPQIIATNAPPTISISTPAVSSSPSFFILEDNTPELPSRTTSNISKPKTNSMLTTSLFDDDDDEDNTSDTNDLSFDLPPPSVLFARTKSAPALNQPVTLTTPTFSTVTGGQTKTCDTPRKTAKKAHSNTFDFLDDNVPSVSRISSDNSLLSAEPLRRTKTTSSLPSSLSLPPPISLSLSHSPSSSSTSQTPLSDVTLNTESIKIDLRRYTITLILDNREIKNRQNRSGMYNALVLKGLAVEQRPLSIGDIAWIAKPVDRIQNNTSDGNVPLADQEIVLDAIIERKRIDDLCASLLGGRYDEQKSRIKKSGMTRKFYLLEHGRTSEAYLKERYHKQITTICAQLQFVDGFILHQAYSFNDIIKYITELHNVVEEIYKGATVQVIRDENMNRRQLSAGIQAYRDNLSTKNMELCTTYSTFQRFNSKEHTVRVGWAEMISSVRGMSYEKTCTFIERWPTPISYWQDLKAKLHNADYNVESQASLESWVDEETGRKDKSKRLKSALSKRWWEFSSCL